MLGTVHTIATPIFMAETFLFKQHKITRHIAPMFLHGPLSVTINCLLTACAIFFCVNPLLDPENHYTGANLVVIALLVNANDISGLEDTIWHLKKNKKLCSLLTATGLINIMITGLLSKGFTNVAVYGKEENYVYWLLRPLLIIGNTILLGLIPGILCCLITKYYHSLRSNAIHEILYVVFFGFILSSASN